LQPFLPSEFQIFPVLLKWLWQVEPKQGIELKKVLIISYYWPPAGGGGVQRWLKMTKYLSEFGWQPIVYTPSNGEAPVIDNSLLKEVHPKLETVKTPIWEPYSLYKLITGKKKNERVYSGFINDKKSGFTQKLSVFIRGNFFIPDARRFWIKPSIKFLKKYLKENPVDAIISTGPPHSMHMIGLGVHQATNIPWVADFRDPWTHIDFYDQLKLTKWGDQKHRKMEQLVLKHCNKLVTVTPSWAQDFQVLSGREDIEIISNGYDPADFVATSEKEFQSFSICHVGSMNKDRNPHVLWKVLKALVEKSPDLASKLQIKLIGQVDHSILESIKEHQLERFLRHISFQPHAEVIDSLGQSYLLLLPVNDTPNSLGVVPGKLFEYMGSGRPIIGIGPLKGDSAHIVHETKSGNFVDYEDSDELTKIIQSHWETFQSGVDTPKSSSIENYSRKNLAKRYAELLENLA
jgi:glycosyltransferase involved in cell wall biosynthesis